MGERVLSFEQALGVVLGERILGPARKVIAEEALPQAAAACELLPSALGSSIGDIASLMAAITEPDLVGRAETRSSTHGLF